MMNAVNKASLYLIIFKHQLIILGLPPKKRKSEQEEEKPRELLKQREGKLNLDSRVGKTHIATSSRIGHEGLESALHAGSGPREPGFYCEACDCVLKDSLSYLDHINGRRHQQNIGYEMKVERSTLEQVKARLAALKAKKAQGKKSYGKSTHLWMISYV
jgi:U4/U6.U5 tri-snRNP component SNU23